MAQPQPTAIFHPGKAPCLGMASAMHPAALEKGHFSLLQNVRLGRRSIDLRDGCEVLAQSGGTPIVPFAGAQPRGAFAGTLDGIRRFVAAFYDSATSKVRVYEYLAESWSSAASELTDTGGPFGDTRLSDAEVFFTVVRDRWYQTEGDLLLIQNGIDSPRVWNPGLTIPGNPNLAVHEEQPAFDNAYAIPSVAGYFLVADSGSGSFSSSGASFALANSGASATDNYLQLTWQAGGVIPAGATSTVQFSDAYNVTGVTAGLQLTYSKQLLLMLEPEYSGLNLAGRDTKDLANLRVEISEDGLSFGVLWRPDVDPGSSLGDQLGPTSVQIIPLSDGSKRYLAAIELDPSVTANFGGQVKYLRFTNAFDVEDPGSDYSLRILMIAASGSVPYGAEYCLSGLCADSRAESAGRVARRSDPVLLSRIGGPQSQEFSEVRLPPDTRLFYTYEVRFKAPDLPSSMDRAYVYRQDPGDDDFYWDQSVLLSVYSSGWGAAPLIVDGEITGCSDYLDTDDRNFTRTAPDAFHIPVPIGPAMAATGARLFVGNGNAYWASESLNAFRFRDIARFAQGQLEAGSPVRNDFAGETVTAFATVTGSLAGIDSLLMFTDQSVYRMDAYDALSLSRPYKIGPHGCPFPKTVATLRNVCYWVDQERQIRRMEGGQIAVVSRAIVDDLLASGELTHSCGAIYRDRYYLSFLPSGGMLYDRILVFDEHVPGFTLDVLGEGDARVLLTFDGSTGRQLLFLCEGAKAGQLYRFEGSGLTSDGATAFQFVVRTGEISLGFWDELEVRRMGMVMPVSNTFAGMVTTTRTFRHGVNPANGSIVLTSTDNKTQVRWDKDSSGNPLGGAGVSAQLSWQGSLPGGQSILGLFAEMGVTGRNNADVA